MGGLPDLSVILGGLLALVAAVAGGFFQLWQGQKEAAAQERMRAENEKGKRLAEQAARAAAEKAKQEADARTREAEQRVRDGNLDHFETE